MNPDPNAPDYVAKRTEHALGLKEKHPVLKESMMLTRRKFLDEYRAARSAGSTVSVLDCMSPQVQTQVCTQLSINYVDCADWFGRPVSSVDEGDFLKYFLLLCENLSEADRQEIIEKIKEIKMVDSSIEAYQKFDPEFWYML